MANNLNGWAVGALLLGATAYYVMTKETKIDRLKKKE